MAAAIPHAADVISIAYGHELREHEETANTRSWQAAENGFSPETSLDALVTTGELKIAL